MTTPVDFKSQMVSQMPAMLDAIAEKLGIMGAHFWEFLVRQELIYGIWCATIVVLFSICLFIILNVLYKIATDKIDLDDGGITKEIIIFWLSVCAVALFSCIVGFSYDAITGIVNPEYAAFDNIVHKIKVIG